MIGINKQTMGQSIVRRSFMKMMVGVVPVVMGVTMLAPIMARADSPTTQSAWHFCRKCNGLFFDGFPDKGRCAAGGTHEAQGLNFLLTHDTTAPGQSGWRFCSKCDQLFFDGSPNKGRCTAGGGHTPAGFNFVLQHDVPGVGQKDWRYCGKCGGLFFDGYPDKGKCSAGGAHSAAGFNFVLPWVTAQAPGALEFDSKPIGFPEGVPVGGWSHLTLYPDGRYHFAGHFHVSGAPSYDVAIAWMVRSRSGQAFLFSKQGKLHGTFESGSRDCDWDTSGMNEDVKRNWAELVAGSRAEWKAKVNVNLSGIIDEVKQAVEVAGQVVKVIQVVAQ